MGPMTFSFMTNLPTLLWGFLGNKVHKSFWMLSWNMDLNGFHGWFGWIGYSNHPSIFESPSFSALGVHLEPLAGYMYTTPSLRSRVKSSKKNSSLRGSPRGFWPVMTFKVGTLSAPTTPQGWQLEIFLRFVTERWWDLIPFHHPKSHPKRKIYYSNHPFSGAMLVSGRVNCWEWCN